MTSARQPCGPVRTVILDNEAVQALASARHRKHRRAMAFVESIVVRNGRQPGSVELIVPTAVRAEAGWVRRAPNAALINRLGIADRPLDADVTDRAAEVRAALSVSIADAHLAAVLAETKAPHAVLTSDVEDLDRICRHLGLTARVVRI